MRADRHPSEEDRLRALASYDIVDSPPEGEYSEIVDLAAAICGTEIALISLVETERQWFKAERGLGICETPINEAICAHAILGIGILEIEDTQADPRTRDNPLCQGDDALRFYAGAPLVGENGLPLGTLCVLSRDPMILSEIQRQALSVLANQVVKLMDLKKALQIGEMLRQEIDHRVKNSLQMISSLARLQKRRVTSQDAIEALEAVDNRIMASVALHEIMHKTNAGDRIDLRTLLTSVCDLISSAKPANVEIEVKAEDVEVSSSRATALASIVNEFVTNSFKHAYPDGRDGTITVSVRKLDCSNFEMVCADDGVGFNAGTADGKSRGLGLMVIQAAAQKIGGVLTPYDGGIGHRLIIACPIED